MNDFNYGKYFYEHKIFDIENKKDIPKMKVAVNDAKKIEKYFFNIVPNIQPLQEIIAFSFKLNPNLYIFDRINYIRGIVYCQDYIDFEDINLFCDEVFNKAIVDFPTIFKEKSFSESKKLDFFDNIMVADRLKGDNFYAISLENENEEYENDDEFNIDGISTLLKEIDNLIDELTPTECEDNSESTIEEELQEISPEDKIELFKQNFNRYVDMIMSSKKIDENKNGNAYLCVILGMQDWFNYVINIIETYYYLSESERQVKFKKLSEFI